MEERRKPRGRIVSHTLQSLGVPNEYSRRPAPRQAEDGFLRGSRPARLALLAAFTNPLTSLSQVSAIGAELKSCAKTLGGSRSIIARRKD